MHPTSLRIAVIGAGPGGLTCARVLQRNGVPVTVFAHEEPTATDPQGGTLELRLTTARTALTAAGLYEEFTAVARPAGRKLRLLDHTGTVLLQDTPDAPAPEGTVPDASAATPDRTAIDRPALRRLLLDSLTPGTVHWGSYLRTLHPLGDGRHRAEFDDGHSETFDLVIGADGAWSRVRPMLSDDTPHYSGVTFVETAIEDADRRLPHLADLVGDGGVLALSAGKGLLARRYGRDRLQVYAGFRGSQDWALEAGVTVADAGAVRALLLDAFAGWDERLRALLRENDGGFASRPLFALPVPHTWAHTPGLTLLGDAAHLMPPLFGGGAGLAMLDGGELARVLAGGGDPDAAVRAYEAAMLPRAARAAEYAAHALVRAFAPDAPDGALRFLRATRQ
ncbi:FAD-dependent oxidoreductase [Streptomyces sp. NPDC058773]|uniref:FAD-dependent oxidoreductase n=1 Tax=Streptomyces sp. NPDC058773 TaxID=3346632 RepID=UPI00369DDF34